MLPQNSSLQELYFSLHKNTFSYCFVKKSENPQSISPKSQNPGPAACFLSMAGLWWAVSEFSLERAGGRCAWDGKRRSEWVKVNIQNKGTVERGFVSKGVAGVENERGWGCPTLCFLAQRCVWGPALCHEWTDHLSNRLIVTPVSTFKSSSLNIWSYLGFFFH